MPWEIDFTRRVRADLVGLEADVENAVMDTLIGWLGDGPPRENARTMLDIEFYEANVAGEYLLAYTIDDARQRFVVLWLRHRPGTGSPV